MSNKCLVTKLKASVQNDALAKLGEEVININVPSGLASQSTNRLSLYSNITSFTVSTTNNKNIYSYNSSTQQAGDNLGTSINVPPLTTIDVCFPEEGEYKILVSDKYIVDTVLLLPTNISMDIKELQYFGFNKLYIRNLYDNNVYGNADVLPLTIKELALVGSSNDHPSTLEGTLAHISGMTSLTRLELNRTNITGNIEALGSLKSLLYLNISGKFSGDIVNMVRNFATGPNGVKTRTFNVPWIGAPNGTITFNGVDVPSSSSTVISWQPSTNAGKLKISVTGMEDVEIDDPA
jgi:hypothetical protein